MEIGKTGVFIALVIALIAIGAYVVVNLDTTGNTVSVTGNSEVTTQPDLVALYFSAETLDNSAQVSEADNAEIAEAVMVGLRALGFRDDEIETLSFNVYPEYEWTKNGTYR